jgi:Acetyltransferase (GNAT) domain
MNTADSSGWDPKSKSPAIEPISSSVRTLCTCKTSFGTATVSDGIPPQEYETWVAGFENYTFDHRYYEIIHNSLKAQFAHYYLFLRGTDGMTRAIQPFLIVSQDIAAGTPEFVRNALAQVRRAIPQFLKLRMLMLGCPAAEGDIVLDRVSRSVSWTVDSLRESLAPVARRLRVALIVFKDYPKRYREHLDRLCFSGYRRVPSMPAVRMDLNFLDFDDYLNTRVSCATRKNLRRKFRKAQRGLPIDWEVVSDISPYVDEVYALYRQTLSRSKFRFQELTRSYFCELSRRINDRVKFFLWRQQGRIIAFACVIAHGGVLRDTYIGLDYTVALKYHLYFVTWRDTIVWGLKNGFHTYHSGPLNYDPKYHLRMALEPLDLYVRSPYGFLNPVFKSILPLLEPTRYDRIIRKFANANELR